MKRADDDWSLPPFKPVVVPRLPRAPQAGLRRRIVEHKKTTASPPAANKEQLKNAAQSRNPGKAAPALAQPAPTEPPDDLTIPYVLLREKPPVGVGCVLTAWGAWVNLRAMLRDAPLSVRIDFVRAIVEPELGIRKASDEPRVEEPPP
jgi:hypothetical protein